METPSRPRAPTCHLGDGAAVDLGIGLAVLGGETGPRTQLVRVTEAVDAADLGHEDRGEDRPDPLDGLHGLVAEVVVEPPGDLGADTLDLGVVEVDQAAQRIDASAVARGEGELIEEGSALRPPQLIAIADHAFFGEHPLDLGLEPGTQHDQLGPVANELSELSHRRWGDPGLGDEVEAQHVEQGVGITDVVLDASGVPVQAERVGQVDVRSQLGEDVARPVPATRRLQDDLGVLAGGSDHVGEVDRVVVDAHRLEPFAEFVGPV